MLIEPAINISIEFMYFLFVYTFGIRVAIYITKHNNPVTKKGVITRMSRKSMWKLIFMVF